MRICLITTTIQPPSVLALYRRFGPDVEFIVAGDRGGPHDDIRRTLDAAGPATYLTDRDQEAMGTRCSEIIGWRKIQRRNLALLEAIRRRPDAIVTIDDDNIPASPTYFDDIRAGLSQPFNGLGFESHAGWFNIGELLTPKTWHRGFPYSRRQPASLSARPVVDGRVGVVAGLWLGDPDVDAMTRIHEGPVITDVSLLANPSVAAAPGCYSPFNSQNTAFLAELAPLMAVHVGVGRYDDIWASYIAERVMHETGHLVTYGAPFVWQERNAQNLWKNLKDEVMGMEETDRFIAVLEEASLDGDTVLDRLRSVYRWCQKFDQVPTIVSDFGLAWCDDVEDALS
jgi:hypothetical protein